LQLLETVGWGGGGKAARQLLAGEVDEAWPEEGRMVTEEEEEHAWEVAGYRGPS
jgi:hypothetical protein